MDNQISRLILTLSPQQGKVHALRWSPSGAALAASCEDGVLVFGAASPLIWCKQLSSGTPTSITWTPDGALLHVGDSEGSIRVYMAETGQLVTQWQAHEFQSAKPTIWELAWSPNGRFLASVASAEARLWAAGETTDPIELGRDAGRLWGLAWAPSSSRLATISDSKTVGLWSSETGEELTVSAEQEVKGYVVRWSPDGSHLVTAGEDGQIRLWRADTLSQTAVLPTDSQYAGIGTLALSADGRYVACSDYLGGIVLRELASGATLFRLSGHDSAVYTLDFSPDGTQLASGSYDGTVCIWDLADVGCGNPLAMPVEAALRSYVARQLATIGRGPAETAATEMTRSGAAADPETPIELEGMLAGALIALVRQNRAAPLSLIRDLLSLTAGRPVLGLARALAAHPGMQALAALRWPPAACVALVLWLLREQHAPAFVPPERVLPEELLKALLQGLGGPLAPMSAPPPPLLELNRALDGVDDRFLTMLVALGPQVCAEDPAILLRFLAQLPALLALSTSDRALLTLRLPSFVPGHAQGPGTFGERTGFTAHGHLRHLVPSQWVLPAQVQAWRMAHGGLLYRARSDKEPPQLPPMVLVLDCSPCCFGHTETLVRSAAFTLGRSLLEAGQRPYLVVATATAAVYQLGERRDLITILTVRSAAAGRAAPALQTAAALREKLRAEHPQEPVILLLTHPWFGAEEEAPQLMVPRLRGLFVHYPKHATVPVLGPRCERYVALSPHDSHRLGQALAELLA